MTVASAGTVPVDPATDNHRVNPIRFSDSIDHGWLNLCHTCNLSCSWCYAQDKLKKNDVMSFEDACRCIDLMHDAGISQINLLGGEPTCYPHLHKLIEYCTNKGIEACLVTNGVLLKNRDYVEQLKKAGLSFLSISIKGDSQDTYILNTQHAAFDDVMTAIRNVADCGIRFSVSYIISLDNIDGMISLFKRCKEQGAYFFDTSFCNPYFQNGSIVRAIDDPLTLIDRFVKVYDEIKELGCEFAFHLDSPMCLWPEGFIEEMASKGHVQSLCQLQKKSGLMLSPNLDVLMCNSLPNYPIGKLGVDFKTAEEMTNFFNSDDVVDVYRRILRAPSKRCKTCEKMKLCGGGCVLWWMVYDLDELLATKDRRKASMEKSEKVLDNIPRV